MLFVIEDGRIVRARAGCRCRTIPIPIESDAKIADDGKRVLISCFGP